VSSNPLGKVFQVEMARYVIWTNKYAMLASGALVGRCVVGRDVRRGELARWGSEFRCPDEALETVTRLLTALR
jgi:hypothetical protein